jgi:uncharacterized damage-inducible protein DinB
VRREFVRVLEGLSDNDCEKRVAGLNSIAWMTAHLMNQEHSYWLKPRGLALSEVEAFNTETANTKTTDTETKPSFQKAYTLWEHVTTASCDWLGSLSDADLRSHLSGRKSFEIENIGSLLTRVIGHYYLHIGQITAIRKVLGYEVPAFVGSQEGAYFE